MPEKTTHDVIVVGGGPAGATASYLLGRGGLDVVLIDKSTFPRKKLCGGLITEKTLRLLQRVYGDSFEALQERRIIEYTAPSFEIRIKDTPYSFGAADPPFVFVDRSVYDHYLLKRAREVGVNVIEGDGVERIDPGQTQVVTSSGRPLNARYIVGADGVNSMVRKALPKDKFTRDRWMRNLAAGLEAFVPRSDINLSFPNPVIIFGLVQWGYAWIFPNRDRVIVGVGALARENENLKKSLEILLATIGYTKDQMPKPLGHPVPYGNFLPAPAHGSILLAGDAAGMVDPFIGEGIYYAQRSAELAAQCILEAASGMDRIEETYPRRLRESVLREFDAIKLERQILFSLAAPLKNAPYKLLLRIFGPRRAYELIQGYRSYRGFRKRGASD